MAPSRNYQQVEIRYGIRYATLLTFSPRGAADRRQGVSHAKTRTICESGRLDSNQRPLRPEGPFADPSRADLRCLEFAFSPRKTAVSEHCSRTCRPCTGNRLNRNPVWNPVWNPVPIRPAATCPRQTSAGAQQQLHQAPRERHRIAEPQSRAAGNASESPARSAGSAVARARRHGSRAARNRPPQSRRDFASGPYPPSIKLCPARGP